MTKEINNIYNATALADSIEGVSYKNVKRAIDSEDANFRTYMNLQQLEAIRIQLLEQGLLQHLKLMAKQREKIKQDYDPLKEQTQVDCGEYVAVIKFFPKV